MDDPTEQYWKLRLESVKEALEKNNFTVRLAETAEAARDVVLDDLLPSMAPKSISWGGSGTFKAAGLYDALAQRSDVEVIDTYVKDGGPEAVLERRRKALLADCFFTGTNALTESGVLVNLDMFGNRVAALAFGPKHVIVLAGRNKLVPDLDTAMLRIKDYASPVNAMRLDKKTPCVKTSECQDCKSPDRICNVWVISEKSYPKGRIAVVLINQNMGI